MLSNNPTGGVPVLQLHPSRRCNLSCSHCYSSSGPDFKDGLALDVLCACLDDAYRLGYRQLAVSGGEPLLYRDLRGLLARARELGMLTTMTTNGMLATPGRWEPIAALLDVAAVSIDGTPEEHDAIRGQRGAFGKTVEQLAVIRDSGVPFGLIFTLTQHNVDSLEFVVRLAAQQGARSVQVHPLTMDGRAASSLAHAKPDTVELVVALIEASRLGRELGVAVHVDAVTAEQLVKYRHQFVPVRPIASLVDVAPLLIVLADATVVPLTHGVDPRFWLGSLNNAGLEPLARRWLADGRADMLADVWERTWIDLAGADGADAHVPAIYWYEEVVMRSRPVPIVF